VQRRISVSPRAGKTLIIGYGNPDRQDDGVAWHIVRRIGDQLGHQVFELLDKDLSAVAPSPVLACMLQLIPELAEALADFERVCFVDAHTGAYAQDIRLETIQPDFQSSPFTHHLTPQTCLVLAESLYGHAPQAVVCSVRGYEFGFERALSPQTAVLAEKATACICTWLESGSAWSSELIADR
jgi:hydrogenase maturation protease